MTPATTKMSAPRLHPALAAALLALALAACGETPPPPKSVMNPTVQSTPAPTPAPAQKPAEDPQADADRALADNVKNALLAEKALNAHGIDVVAKRGVVTLFGTTKTPVLRGMAEKIAARVNGVTLVDNKLAVVAGS